MVGAGVSGHELAHDLWEHGADVTLLQRSATYVVSFDGMHKFWNPLFSEDMVYTPEFADQIQYSVPNVRTDVINKELVKKAAAYDKELLDGLERIGFKLEWGPDGTGHSRRPHVRQGRLPDQHRRVPAAGRRRRALQARL